MKTFLFTLSTNQGEIFKDDIKMLVLDTMDGEISILPDHCDLISVIKENGNCIIHRKASLANMNFNTSGGILSVWNNNVILSSKSIELL